MKSFNQVLKDHLTEINKLEEAEYYGDLEAYMIDVLGYDYEMMESLFN